MINFLPTDFDSSWVSSFHPTKAWPLLDGLMTFLSASYLWVGVGVLGILASIRLSGKRALYPVFCIIFVLSFTDALVGHGLKNWIFRIRPCKTLEFIRVVDGCAGFASFPSNHAANAAATAASFFFLGFRKIFWGLVPVVLAVSFSRLYLGVHYPTDIFGGLLIGFIVAGAFSRFGVFKGIERLVQALGK